MLSKCVIVVDTMGGNINIWDIYDRMLIYGWEDGLMTRGLLNGS